MATINSEIEFQGNNDAFFTTNAAVIYDAGIIIYHTDGRYKFADGVTALSALPFLGGGNQTLSQVLANGNNVNATDINSTTGKSILSLFDGLARLFFNDNNSGYVSINDSSADISHDVLIELNAPSVKKNGVELVTVNDLPNFEGLKSGGTITVGTFGGSGVDNDIRVSAASWVVGTTYYSTAINTDFLDIALSSSGLQRYVGLYGTTSNTITKVEGSEAALATYPTTPANTIVIGYVLVNDASASTTPDLSGYLLKLDKATQSSNQTGTDDTTYVTPFSNAIKQNLLVSGTNIKTVNGTSLLGSGDINTISYSPIHSSVLVSHTGTTAETILNSSLIPAGSFLANDGLRILANIMPTAGAANNRTNRWYFNTVNSLTGATLIATYTHTSTAVEMIRNFSFSNSLSSIRIFSPTQSLANEELSSYNTQFQLLAVPTFANDVYFICTTQLSVGTDTQSLCYLKSIISRQ